jgi:hypothetical protein
MPDTQVRPGEATSPQETPGADRVRERTDPGRVADIDAATRRRVEAFVDRSDEAITRRITELEQESDIERALATNASVLALTGIVLGLARDRRFLVLPLVVLSFLLQHARQGWCPPLPLFRRLGYRSRQEIDAEKQALKALRGDFEDLVARRRS